MNIKKVLFSIGRSFLKLVLLASLFVGSLAGFGVAIRYSPYLFMSEIDEITARKQATFFVAFKARDESGNEEVRILPYQRLLEHPPGDFRSFRLAKGELDLDLPGGDSASVRSETNNRNIQTTTVHVVGDTPWVSVSVYEVHSEKVVPLRLGQTGFWLLGVGFFVVPLLLVFIAQKPVTRIAGMVFPPESGTKA